MEILEIKPKEGIGLIKLGMERAEVYRILNKAGSLNAAVEWVGDYHIEYKTIRWFSLKYLIQW